MRIPILSFILLTQTLCINPIHASDPIHSPLDIVRRLDALKGFESDATIRTCMVHSGNDIEYTLHLLQQDTPDDPFDTDAYIIEWSPGEDDSPTADKGFATYYDGHHYRFNGDRLQEYHALWDSVPFKPAAIGLKSEGIQRNARFFNLLPQSIAADIKKISEDPAYTLRLCPDTVVEGRHMTALLSEMTVNGSTASTAKYFFDHATLHPLYIHIINNPATTTEQTMDVEFRNSRETPIQISELIASNPYKQIIDTYSHDLTPGDNLSGRRFPAFSLPTTTGERYSRSASDHFRSPTFIVILDTDTKHTPDVIETVRKAAADSPVRPDIIWAFADNVADRIEPLVGAARVGETTLMSARRLMRDCHITELPTIYFLDIDGSIKNVIIGANNVGVSDVIQETTTLK